MRKSWLALMLVAVPAVASSGYKFHIRLTDARSALQSTPDLANLKKSEEELERAARDRVMMLDHTSGVHWRWLMLGWPEGQPTREQGIDDRGGAAPGKGADVSLTPLDTEKVRIRCYRAQCGVRVGDGERVVLRESESTDVPFDSDLEITFESR